MDRKNNYKHEIMEVTLKNALDEFNSKKMRKLTSLKPTSWGKGTEKVSEHVDEIMYD